jgi:hypothetical protein
MTVSVNGKDAYDVQLPMPYEETGKLSADAALALAQQHVKYAVAVDDTPVVKHQLTYDPQCLRVDLQLITAASAKNKRPRKPAVSVK